MGATMGADGRARQGVFISYARVDGEAAARALQQRLAGDAPDIPAWLDRNELEGGVGWWSQIERELDRAEFLILVMTPAAMASENTRREWRCARQRGVCIYPVKGLPDVALDYASLPVWMRKAHFYDPAIEWQKLLLHLRRGCQATRVPFMAPPLPEAHVQRPRERAELLAFLLAPEVRSVAVRGAGGYGKTTLAAAICHDDAVAEHFDDGVLWVSLGQTPNLLNELIKLFAALTGERPAFVDIDDAARELALRLESRHCLVVIDDVWNPDHLRPFMQGAPQCTRLVTTRRFDVALDAQRVELDRMDEAEALQLLIARTGTAPRDERGLRELVARLGGWPLPLKLAGAAMRQRIARGDAAEGAVDYVLRTLAKRGITAFDQDSSARREEAVARTIGASLELLDADARQRCAQLAIFPQDTAVPLGTAAALWQLDELDSEDLVRRLDDLALVEFDLRRGSFRMHDVLRGFFAARLEDAAGVHRSLIEHWGDACALPDAYAWRHYAWHLCAAGRQAQLRQLLFDFRWIDAKLRATDVLALIADFELAGKDPALQMLCDALRLAAPALSADVRQLASQLLGRTLARGEPEILSLREAAARRGDGVWLQPLNATLDEGGGPLKMSLLGHEKGVTALALSADWQTLFSGSNDGSVRVWELASGSQTVVLDGGALGVRALALSEDGSRLLGGGGDGVLQRFEGPPWQLVGRFSGGMRRGWRAVALSPDGRLALSASRDETLLLWDVEAGAVLRELPGHEECINSVAFAAGGEFAISGSDDGTARIWRVADGDCLRVLREHDGPVNAVTMSRNGRFALTGGTDGRLRWWDAATGACLRTLEGQGASITAIALAADAPRAISGDPDSGLVVWDVEAGRLLARLEGHGDAITAVAIDAAGQRAASASADRSIKLWRLDAEAPIRSDLHRGAVVSLAFSEDGALCASGGEDGRLKVRDAASGQVITSVAAHTAPLRSLAFTHDGGCVLSAGMDHRFWQWTVETGERNWLPVRHGAPIDYCALSARTRYLVTSCSDRFVYFWDMPSGSLIARYGTRRLFDHLIPASPKRGALADDDELLDTYLPGEPVFKVELLRLSDDGSFALLSASRSQAASIRTAAEKDRAGTCLLALNIGSGEIMSVELQQSEVATAFAIDATGGRLLWARPDHSLELWDLRRELRIGVLRGHTERVNTVAFDSEGTRAFSCGRDRSLRAWDLATLAPLASFTADAALRALAVAPGGRRLAVGDVAGRVHLLQLSGL